MHLAMPSASVADCAQSLASSIARASSRSSSTSSVTRSSFSASSPESMRPDSTSSLARSTPTYWLSRNTEPPSGARPTFLNTCPNLACGEARM